MKRSLAILLFCAIPVAAVACGGTKVASPPPAHAAAQPATTGAPAPKAAAGPDPAAVRAFLEPRPGEQPADAAPIPGVRELDENEAAMKAKCSAAKEKALAKTAKQPVGKQMSAALAAMDKTDKRCLDVGLREQTQSQAKLKDMRAQDEMRMLARGLSRGGASCGDGAPNPAASMGACFLGVEPFLFDREGWSCATKALSKEDKESFSLGAAYIYAFHVDPKLGTYEIVGHGCQMLLGNAGGPNAETELVLRGKLGEDPTETPIYRRAPSAKPR